MAVTFNEPSGAARRTKRPSFFSRIVINTGLAKTEAGAQAIMLIVAFLLAIAGYFMLQQGNQLPPPPDPEQTRINV